MYKLYSNCIPVKGYSRSIICDLQNRNYHLIPNSLYEIIDGDIININLVEYTEEEKAIINEYLEFLLEMNLVFEVLSDEIELFPKLNLEWDYPSIITNAIIDVKDEIYDWASIIEQLLEVKCYHIQIRFFDYVCFAKLNDICRLMYSSHLYSIDLILPYDKNMENEEWISFIARNPKIRKLIIYNSVKDEVTNISNKGFSAIYNIKSNCNSQMHCGSIDRGYFTTNIPTFTESQNYNTCLNKKIGIDINGNIKNCPSCKKIYGNINETSLYQAIHKSGFKDYWNISKDKISVCQDCEFRHICIDCRAFIKDSENIYSQPLKCNYNPYISKWSDEDGYIAVEECGTYSKKRFIPDKDKIKLLNKQLWQN